VYDTVGVTFTRLDTYTHTYIHEIVVIRDNLIMIILFSRRRERFNEKKKQYNRFLQYIKNDEVSDLKRKKKASTPNKRADVNEIYKIKKEVRRGFLSVTKRVFFV